MTRSHPLPRHAAPILALAAAAALAACGGGGGAASEEPVAPAPAAPAALAAIDGVVADGPLAGVAVCYDLNDNAACDAGEPASAPTDADGRYTLSIPAAEAGRHAVVAEVPASAIDRDTGAPVGTAIVLLAPATGQAGSQSVFVSALTTLVQARLERDGGSLAEAASFVQTNAAMALSPLQDFTAAPASADTRFAATVARMATTAWYRQTDMAAGAVGQIDLSGSAATPADARRAVAQAVLDLLPALGAAAGAITPLDGAMPRPEAAAQAAQEIVETQSPLTAATALTAIGAAKLPADASPESPAAGGQLNMLRYTDADHWSFRALLSDAADSVPDATGRLRFYDLRRLHTPDGTVSWGSGNTPERESDLHWNGSAWVGCPLGTRSHATPRDAAGRSAYDYCDGREIGTSVRRSLDIGGRSLRSVAATIRSAPGVQFGIPYAEWGPADLSLLGDAVFPADAQLRYQVSTPARTAPIYDVRANNVVNAYPVAVAAGGDARQGTAPTCAGPTATGTPNGPSAVASLEDMVGRAPGRPCIFGPATNTNGRSGEVNEWWSNSTLSLGSVAGAQVPPEGTGAYYTTTALLRVSFTPGSTVATFHSCLARADGSTRNCRPLSTGSYRIETLGDARVMSFSGLPALVQRVGFQRVFVERGGKVYYGYQGPAGIGATTLRLNLPAANAVFAQLGLPALVP